MSSQLFDSEASHLLSIHLLREVQEKLGPVHSALDWTVADTQSKFVERTWKKSLNSAYQWKFTSENTNSSSKPIYKSCLVHYIRSVLKRSDQKAVPKLHHFMRKFFDKLLSYQEIKSGDFFGSFGHSDQLSCVRAAMRECLHDLLSIKPMAMSQISVSIQEENEEAPSVGPDDSVSVATFSKLMPRGGNNRSLHKSVHGRNLRGGKSVHEKRIDGVSHEDKKSFHGGKSVHGKSVHGKSVHGVKSIHGKSVHGKSVHEKSIHGVKSVHERNIHGKSVYAKSMHGDKKSAHEKSIHEEKKSVHEKSIHQEKKSVHRRDINRDVRSVTLSMESRSVR